MSDMIIFSKDMTQTETVSASTMRRRLLNYFASIPAQYFTGMTKNEVLTLTAHADLPWLLREYQTFSDTVNLIDYDT